MEKEAGQLLIAVEIFLLYLYVILYAFDSYRILWCCTRTIMVILVSLSTILQIVVKDMPQCSIIGGATV